MSDPLYFDIETTADPERRYLYEPPIGVLEADAVGGAEAITDAKGKAVDDLLRNPRVTFDWLCRAHVAEQRAMDTNGRPPRVTVLDKIAKRIASLGKDDKKQAASLVPEHGRIVAFGMGDHFETDAYLCEGVDDERRYLREFWRRVEGNVKVVGWNVAGFDLPFVFARSIVLGVEPTRRIDTRPYETPGVCDLMLARYGNRGWRKCDDVAHEYGFGMTDDISGADVAAAFDENPELVVEHVKTDVDRVRHLHRCWNGFFCDRFTVPEEVEW